uniref:Uncharacterized protein n=1 Tax=Arundo donax TaxID=35708 RepID=A0A0A9DDR1_ARUDO
MEPGGAEGIQIGAWDGGDQRAAVWLIAWTGSHDLQERALPGMKAINVLQPGCS